MTLILCHAFKLYFYSTKIEIVTVSKLISSLSSDFSTLPSIEYTILFCVLLAEKSKGKWVKTCGSYFLLVLANRETKPSFFLRRHVQKTSSCPNYVPSTNQNSFLRSILKVLFWLVFKSGYYLI